MRWGEKVALFCFGDRMPTFRSGVAAPLFKLALEMNDSLNFEVGTGNRDFEFPLGIFCFNGPFGNAPIIIGFETLGMALPFFETLGMALPFFESRD